MGIGMCSKMCSYVQLGPRMCSKCAAGAKNVQLRDPNVQLMCSWIDKWCFMQVK